MIHEPAPNFKKNFNVTFLLQNVLSNYPDSKEGCHFTFHRLSAKTFQRKPFRKPLPQGLRRKAFYEPPVQSCVAPSGIVVSALPSNSMNTDSIPCTEEFEVLSQSTTKLYK
ncbi:hypothetical protein AVEN_181309-1 [Araneus ventricosus]|uniref:Uncharacterized protein n=1 Tax=Araneus ventricosus TaxID=182803 RepID=A0A4Y2EIZ1_ARAVE|nr:hypothetical protein AVEN_181309-1 [Araneus ventricosus]